MLESEECVERVACNINNLIEEIRLNSRFEPGADTDSPCLMGLLVQGKSHIIQILGLCDFWDNVFITVIWLKNYIQIFK